MSILKQLLAELDTRRLLAAADEGGQERPYYVWLTGAEVNEIGVDYPAALGRDADGARTCLGMKILDAKECLYPDRVRGLGEHWMERRTPLGEGRGWRFEGTPGGTGLWGLDRWMADGEIVVIHKPASVGKTEIAIDWAKKNMALQDEFEAAGRWRAADTPYLREALKVVDDPNVTRLAMRPRGGDL
jgi:hypothetical protein